MKICPVKMDTFAKSPEITSPFDKGGGKMGFCEFIRIIA